jgi:hypothetical protein
MPLTKRLLISLAAVAAVCAVAVPAASASTSQITIMQDNNAINKNPVQALTKMKQMGVTMVKYVIYWDFYVPDPNSTKAPAGATMPSTYTSHLVDLAVVDQAAAKVGIKLGFMVTAPAPRWASTNKQGTGSPNAADFQAFMSSLGTFFNGSTPGVAPVRWWSVWNEPNYIPNLSPQLSGTTYKGPDLYRSLLNSAWKGLTTTGHTTKSDTILFGEVAPRGISGGNQGQGPAQNGAGYKPIAFFNALYCETAAGKRFTGKLASANGCSSSAAAFKSANPALFDASGVADHPYSQGLQPNQKSGDCKVPGVSGNAFCLASKAHPADPYWTDLASISNLENGLAKNLKVYGSTKKYPIWSTEYGFWTTPPGKLACKGSVQSDCSLSQANAAYYSNWAEYLSYKNSRIVSFDQYQLYDPNSGVWTDGLLTSRGVPKATFDPWELPLYLPTTSVKKASSLTVWGGAKPAAVDKALGATPTVRVQFKGRTGGWKTVATVIPSTTNNGGYFTTKVKFTASGSVRLTYTAGATSLTSRTQAITVG